MVIKNLSFLVFTKLFKGHPELILGIALEETGTMTLMLSLEYFWEVHRGAGDVRIFYSKDGKSEKLGSIDVRDFEKIEIV